MSFRLSVKNRDCNRNSFPSSWTVVVATPWQVCMQAASKQLSMCWMDQILTDGFVGLDYVRTAYHFDVERMVC